MPNSLKILFASYHSILDHSSGAAICTHDTLEALGGLGWEVKSFTGPLLDGASVSSIPSQLETTGAEFQVVRSQKNGNPFSLTHYRDGMISGTHYDPGDVADVYAKQNVIPFMALYERLLERFQPNVVLTYGGYWFAPSMIGLSRRRGVKVVFSLHNFAYEHAELFAEVDAIKVPSSFAANWYRDKLGIRCTPLPSIIDWNRVECDRAGGDRYVTFINPQPEKGVFVFARIAEMLGEIRPDIQLLIVESRSSAEQWLERTGLDLSHLRNLHRMKNTSDPRDFYRASHLVVMPSVWNESFGRVVAEAMINGIPVLCSNRGSLPEIVGDGGIVLDVAHEITPTTRILPTPEQVRPWVDWIIRLWDDPACYAEVSRRGKARAEQWRPEAIARQYDEFFRAGVII